VTCTDVVKNDAGEVVELHCTYDPETRGGTTPDGRKVKATLHWVSAAHAVEAEVRLYDRLFQTPRPGKDTGNYVDDINPQSLQVLTGCRVEPSVCGAEPGHRYQFERQGYFCIDPDSSPTRPVFNRTVPLRDAWAKIDQAAGRKGGKAS